MNYSYFKKNAEKVRQMMREKGIDLFILTHQQKYSYVTGNYHNDYNLGNCCFVWKDREPTMLVNNAEYNRLFTEGYITDVRAWNSHYTALEPNTKGFLDVVIDIIREYDADKDTIAVELPSIPYLFYRHLEENLPGATLVDGEDYIDEVMMVKDAEEMAMTRRVSAIADAGAQKLMDNARVGITEAELMGHAELEMRRLGATYYYSPNQCLFNSRGYGDHLPTDTILRKGDIIACDVHPVWHEYRTDCFRMMSFGEQSKSYNKMMDVMREKVMPDLLGHMKNGNSTKDIEKWYYDRVKEVGYPNVGGVGLGHGIGTGHLPPFFETDKEWILKPNVLVSLCPNIYDLNAGDVWALEFLLAIREEGPPEILTKHPLDLIVLPIK